MSASDHRLAELLADAVEPVEPSYRLGVIRATVHPAPRRRWHPALVAAAGTAAVLVALVVVGGQVLPDRSGPAVPPTAPGTSVAVYYVGDTEGAGPRLFREFRRLPASDRLDAAVQAAVGRSPDGAASEPLDPDYRSAWPAGTTAEASFDGVGPAGEFTIDLGSGVEGSLRERPTGMGAAEAAMAVEQLVWTAQAAGQVRAPVRILLDGEITDQVLGVPASEPLARGAALQVLNLASITSPAQGATVTGDTLEVTGVANSFEATVGWELLREGEPVRDGYATTEGWMEERLFPFTTLIDVAGLAPGDYTLVVSTGDPSAGVEGRGPMRDTRDVTIE